MMSATGLDNASVKQLAKAADFVYEAVEFPGAPEGIKALMDGEIDLFVSSAFSVDTEVAAQELKGVIAMSETPLTLLPYVPTSAELGYDAYMGPLRGIVCIKGTPEAAIAAIVEAASLVEQDSDW